MSRKCKDMHQLQERVRLHRLGTGAREVARLLGVSPNTEHESGLGRPGWLRSRRRRRSLPASMCEGRGSMRSHHLRLGIVRLGFSRSVQTGVERGLCTG
jgi:hypothetical protein